MTAPTALSESPDLLEVTGRPEKVENLGKNDVLTRSGEGGAFTAFVTSVPPAAPHSPDAARDLAL